MRFVVDASTGMHIVRHLRASGHDVLAVAEIMPNAQDKEILAVALEQARVLVTNDKDFGELVFRSELGCPSPTSLLAQSKCIVPLSVRRATMPWPDVTPLRAAVKQMDLSARAYDCVLKLARTIADLAGEENIQSQHLAEALQYRPRRVALRSIINPG